MLQIRLVLSVFDALTWSVLATALIAKFIFTSTSHMITPLRFLNPKFAFWALFKILAIDELQEFFIISWHSIWYSVFLASLPSMEWNSAFHAIILITFWACKLDIITFLEDKCVLTPWSWAPLDILLDISCLFYSPLVIFL